MAKECLNVRMNIFNLQIEQATIQFNPNLYLSYGHISVFWNGPWSATPFAPAILGSGQTKWSRCESTEQLTFLQWGKLKKEQKMDSLICMQKVEWRCIMRRLPNVPNSSPEEEEEEEGDDG